MNTLELQGKVAIVTGGGKGIGRGISLALGRNGAKVVVVDMAYVKSQQVVKEIEASGGKAIAVKTDVTNGDEVNEMVRKTVEDYGKIDGCIC